MDIIHAPLSHLHFGQILTKEALEFIFELEQKFSLCRQAILDNRASRQSEIDSGNLPTFPTTTSQIRKSHWKAATIPSDLLDRRVEITGPPDRKMIINALNSGANVFMADFEDSHAPTWEATLQGHINLRDAVNKTISFHSEIKAKCYSLNEKTATLMVRPRGWHLEEQHVLVNDKPISASLFDFGLFFFHNAKTLIKKRSGPYFYLPKLESRFEARLWNDVFIFAQDYLGIAQGTIRATVLLENILASFEMEEILYELREHSAGLNCGRWDYIFSAIRHFRNHDQFTLPDRSAITMESKFMRAYSKLVIEICHKRGAHAIGGMSTQIPIKNDPQANEKALEKVRLDKLREVKDGHDGTWVAHPGLVPIAKEIFDTYMPTPNQIHLKTKSETKQEDLLPEMSGKITLEGMLTNIDVAIQYLAAWLNGNGCVPIYNLMEDAATAEICRSQLWQWVNSPSAKLENGQDITPELYQELVPQAMQRIKREASNDRYDSEYFEEGLNLLNDLVLQKEFTDFLTIPAYQKLIATH